MMKKIFLILFTLICFGATAKAQNVCKISGSNDNVEIFSSYIDEDNNQIVVTVGNDSNDISANVTITIQVSARKKGNSGMEKLTLSGKEIAKPNRTTTINIPLTGGYEFTSNSKIIDRKISGTKCL